MSEETVTNRDEFIELLRKVDEENGKIFEVPIVVESNGSFAEFDNLKESIKFFIKEYGEDGIIWNRSGEQVDRKSSLYKRLSRFYRH